MSDSRAVQITLMGVLIGVGLPIAIGNALATDSIWTVLACAAFVLQALNFFHGKVSTLDDADYSLMLRANPRIALADYALNMALAVAFAVVGVAISAPLTAVLANLALRLVDIPLVLIGLRASLSPTVLRAHRSWLVFDVVSVVIWAAVATAAALVPESAFIMFGLVYLVVAVADIAMDYTYNATLYFRPPNAWDSFTQTWDDIQGASGDPVRARVVTPALLSQLHDEGVLSVIDLGCGNGAIARNLAADGFEVLGVDKSASMIVAARSYSDGPYPQYLLADIADVKSADKFDAAVCVFMHHVVGDLDTVFDAARRVLRRGGLFILVGEDLGDEEMPILPHSTRRWLDRAHRNGARRQLIFWREPATTEVVAVSRATHWTDTAVSDAAERAGARCIVSPTTLGVNGAITEPLRRYASRPYMRQWVFRLEDNGVNVSGIV